MAASGQRTRTAAVDRVFVGRERDVDELRDGLRDAHDGRGRLFLIESHADGDDILWFNDPGAVHALYYANGPANDGDALGINDFRSVYREAASAGHATYIDDIFAQNDTD